MSGFANGKHTQSYMINSELEMTLFSVQIGIYFKRISLNVHIFYVLFKQAKKFVVLLIIFCSRCVWNT